MNVKYDAYKQLSQEKLIKKKKSTQTRLLIIKSQKDVENIIYVFLAESIWET